MASYGVSVIKGIYNVRDRCRRRYYTTNVHIYYYERKSQYVYRALAVRHRLCTGRLRARYIIYIFLYMYIHAHTQYNNNNNNVTSRVWVFFVSVRYLFFSFFFFYCRREDIVTAPSRAAAAERILLSPHKT